MPTLQYGMDPHYQGCALFHFKWSQGWDLVLYQLFPCEGTRPLIWITVTSTYMSLCFISED